jgi:hypothetical protein
MEPPAKDREHETKAGIYETWAVVNRAFEQIVNALDKLQKIGVLSGDHAQDHDTLTNDLWARINIQIMIGVSKREEDDRAHYGKMRATLERRIRGRQ